MLLQNREVVRVEDGVPPRLFSFASDLRLDLANSCSTFASRFSSGVGWRVCPEFFRGVFVLADDFVVIAGFSVLDGNGIRLGCAKNCCRCSIAANRKLPLW